MTSVYPRANKIRVIGKTRRFYRSCGFISGNKRDILFNVNAEKEKRQNACSQMTSVFLPRE